MTVETTATTPRGGAGPEEATRPATTLSDYASVAILFCLGSLAALVHLFDLQREL